jgi:S-adenosyl-L-methionine hydrolase (adenosine-forming)
LVKSWTANLYCVDGILDIPMTIITMTTDFGLADGYVGIMKGVILDIAPHARLVDLSHEIAPQDVQHAAYVLRRATPYFPRGAIHLAVVDPGVGSTRRPLLVMTARAAFVGPDNGLFTAALDDPGAAAWTLDKPEFWLPQRSATFHGRDVFAPVAAHLAMGRTAQELGSLIDDAVRLPALLPERIGTTRVRGHVIHVDRFGNLISSIPATWVSEGQWSCSIAGRTIERISRTYADAAPGALLALVGSGGTVEIAVRDGSAAQTLGTARGASVGLTRN